jgi:MFS family permease
LTSAESFPTPLRGHFLGLAAAFGKAGAAISTQVFTPIQDSFSDSQKGIQGVFLIGAAFALTGGLVSWFLIPDKEKELEGEDERFRKYLAAHGYHGSFGESLESEVNARTFRGSVS